MVATVTMATMAASVCQAGVGYCVTRPAIRVTMATTVSRSVRVSMEVCVTRPLVPAAVPRGSRALCVKTAVRQVTMGPVVPSGVPSSVPVATVTVCLATVSVLRACSVRHATCRVLAAPGGPTVPRCARVMGKVQPAVTARLASVYVSLASGVPTVRRHVKLVTTATSVNSGASVVLGSCATV